MARNFKNNKGEDGMNTVNVIEIIDGNIKGLNAFADNKIGNKKAEKLFAKKFVENGGYKNVVPRCQIEDGYYELGGYELFLIHST